MKTSDSMTLKEIANDLGYRKIGGFWFSDFYLDLLDCTPYDVGESVYISDGMYCEESGLTNDELKQLYEEELRTRNE